MFINKKQLLCLNTLSLEIQKKLIKTCIRSVTVYGSETRTVGKCEERVVNAFETWSWKGMLKIKWTDEIRNGFPKGERRKIVATQLQLTDIS
jgi:hypothetical protein